MSKSWSGSPSAWRGRQTHFAPFHLDRACIPRLAFSPAHVGWLIAWLPAMFYVLHPRDLLGIQPLSGEVSFAGSEYALRVPTGVQDY